MGRLPAEGALIWSNAMERAVCGLACRGPAACRRARDSLLEKCEPWMVGVHTKVDTSASG